MKWLLPIMICTASTALADHELHNRDISSGETLYAEKCASCHGANLEGQPNWQQAGADGVLPAPPHDDTGHTWHHDNALLFEYTRLGGKGALALRGIDFQSGMPAFEGAISDDDIWDILAYISSSWSDRALQAQANRNPSHQ